MFWSIFLQSLVMILGIVAAGRLIAIAIARISRRADNGGG